MNKMKKDNPAILSKYILTGTLNDEWLVVMYPCPNYSSIIDFIELREPNALAVYKPTGRSFIENGKISWEYRYEGIRIKNG